MQRIGIIGCGQLARMMALEGTRMGFEFVFIAIGDEDVAPVQSLTSTLLLRWFEHDNTAVAAALKQCDVITTERENLPAALLALAETTSRLYPRRQALEMFSRRDNERASLTQLGLPISPFVIVTDPGALAVQATAVGFPLVIKAVCNGYDGKGQWRAGDANALRALEIPAAAFPLLVEQQIDFVRELSITAVRSGTGEVRCYALTENRHVNGILVSACAPAKCRASTERLAQTWANYLLNSLDYVGVLTIELFETAQGLLINEIAPRVHNSAHWTLGGAMTSQFENHLRAVTGAPLGATSLLTTCGIVNVLGRQAPENTQWLGENMRLHCYAKTERPGRKLGHVLVMESRRERLEQQLLDLQHLLTAGNSATAQ